MNIDLKNEASIIENLTLKNTTSNSPTTAISWQLFQHPQLYLKTKCFDFLNFPEKLYEWADQSEYVNALIKDSFFLKENEDVTLIERPLQKRGHHFFGSFQSEAKPTLRLELLRGYMSAIGMTVNKQAGNSESVVNQARGSTYSLGRIRKLRGID